MDFKTIYEFILNNFMPIIICLTVVGVALKVANMLIRIIATIITILIVLKVFFIR